MEATGPGPDPLFDLRRIGVTAAALSLVFVITACAGSKAASGHSCGATDKRFIETASINMTALGIWAAGFQSGEIDPEEVAEEAKNAAKRVAYVKPRDPSLLKAQELIDAMFNEYGLAVTMYAEGKEAGPRMYRAYGLANFARDVLVAAEPELAKRGCDVAPLL